MVSKCAYFKPLCTSAGRPPAAIGLRRIDALDAYLPEQSHRKSFYCPIPSHPILVQYFDMGSGAYANVSGIYVADSGPRYDLNICRLRYPNKCETTAVS